MSLSSLRPLSAGSAVEMRGLTGVCNRSSSHRRVAASGLCSRFCGGWPLLEGPGPMVSEGDHSSAYHLVQRPATVVSSILDLPAWAFRLRAVACKFCANVSGAFDSLCFKLLGHLSFCRLLICFVTSLSAMCGGKIDTVRFSGLTNKGCSGVWLDPEDFSGVPLEGVKEALFGFSLVPRGFDVDNRG